MSTILHLLKSPTQTRRNAVPQPEVVILCDLRIFPGFMVKVADYAARGSRMLVVIIGNGDREFTFRHSIDRREVGLERW